MSQISRTVAGTETGRRDFLKQAGVTAAGLSLLGANLPRAYAAGDETLKIGLIGCGGRGTGAAVQALSTAGNVKLVAMGDAFADRLESSLQNIQKEFSARPERVAVDPAMKFVGFDAYKQVIATDVDAGAVTECDPEAGVDVARFGPFHSAVGRFSEEDGLSWIVSNLFGAHRSCFGKE